MEKHQTFKSKEPLKVLIAGAGGYIGSRLIQSLAEKKVRIYCLVRSKDRLHLPMHLERDLRIFEADLLKKESLSIIPEDIDAAYYLVHSMGQSPTGFTEAEKTCAQNFASVLSKTNARQIIYLSGLSHKKEVSEHLSSRDLVDKVLRKGTVPVTTLHAGIIIGSGSASFEILRDLVEKLPFMIAPRWLHSKCQPIGIGDVLYYLKNVLLKSETIGSSFDIGGPNVLSYKQMLLQLSQVRKLRRWIITVPVLTPKLSSLWLYLVTSTNFSLARALVDSLKTDTVCKENEIDKILPRKCLTYKQTIRRAFQKIEQNAVVSSWKTALVRSRLSPHLETYIQVPEKGCFKEICKMSFPIPKDHVIDRLWEIGGENGWYYMDYSWTIRGFIDKLVGGVGLKRGRKNPQELKNGDVLDFWRVLFANKAQGRLLLFAEMKVPGEAWLEWKIQGDSESVTVVQTATFRPRGIFGRIYWYCLYPIHKLIFSGLCKSLGKNSENN